MKKALACLAALSLGMAAAAWAQEEAPQVLTSDLALRQEVDTDRITVNFVIVDDDNVTKVSIDGEEQKIVPGDTVLITKEFVFTKGRHIIRVLVEDQKGNKRERSYLVAYGVPVELTAEEKKKKSEETRYGFVYDIRYEFDGNPTLDLSLPFTNLEGFRTEDEDYRTVLKALATVSGGDGSGYLGFVDTAYEKDINELVNSRAIFLGGAIKFGENKNYLFGGALIDVDVGGDDYALLATLSPGYESRGRDEDGAKTILYGVDLTSKRFEDLTRKDGFEVVFKRAYSTLYDNKLDTYKSLFALGNGTEGTAKSEFFFFRSDFDWANKWDNGAIWDIGFGYKYRDYPKDKDVVADDIFGKSRVDNIFDFTTGAGKEFSKFTLKFELEYTVDVSTGESYERLIYGLSLQGAF